MHHWIGAFHAAARTHVVLALWYFIAPAAIYSPTFCHDDHLHSNDHNFDEQKSDRLKSPVKCIDAAYGRQLNHHFKTSPQHHDLQPTTQMLRTSMTFLIALSACTSSESHTTRPAGGVSTIRPVTETDVISTDDSVTPNDDSLLLGAWTDGSSENASFAISKDSIFYVEALTSYQYTLKGDSLIIAFPGMKFRGTVTVKGDTLTINEPGSGTSKYTRFND
jgi:hypothetical protein